MVERFDDAQSTTIMQNCPLHFQCTQQWSELEGTEKEDIRFCFKCERNVFLINSYEELRDAVLENKCVAFFTTDYAKRERNFESPNYLGSVFPEDVFLEQWRLFDEVKLVGLQYCRQNYQAKDFTLGRGLILTAELENPHDPYAVKASFISGEKVGYISRDSNQAIWELIQSGKTVGAEITTTNQSGNWVWVRVYYKVTECMLD